MERLRTLLVDFTKSLTNYDYIGFILALVLFVLFLVLALILRRRVKLALFLSMLSFLSLFSLPVAMHLLVKKTLFKNEAKIELVKKLHYSDTLLIKGTLFYKGSYEAKHCKVEVAVHKKDQGFFKDLAYAIKPYKKGKWELDKAFSKGDTVSFKVVIEPYLYQGDYNLSLSSECTL